MFRAAELDVPVIWTTVDRVNEEHVIASWVHRDDPATAENSDLAFAVWTKIWQHCFAPLRVKGTSVSVYRLFVAKLWLDVIT